MSREYTKCDADGVPRLVQKIKYRGHLLLWECTLFNGSEAYFDMYDIMGISANLAERLKITDDFIYNYLEDYIKKNMHIYFYKNRNV